jgi:hypothetical protein
MTESGGSDLGGTRQQAIDALCEHFANDVLSMEEFERRVELAQKAEGTEELRKLLQDLPTGDLPIRREEMSPSAPPRAEASVPSTRVKERGLMVAALGGVERKGRWIPARQTYAVAVMGGMHLDFREALLPPGETEVWIFTIMGGAEIVVPPGLAVESDGIAIMGGFEHREDAPMNQDPNAPVLRLKGLALMGGVEVSIRYPGESARDAKRRLKEKLKEQRRIRRGR